LIFNIVAKVLPTIFDHYIKTNKASFSAGFVCFELIIITTRS
jgi:hypothetical protein